jgi:hypothetical protein
MNLIPRSKKPLANLMIKILMDCHERELMNLEPYDAFTVPYPSGLIVREMLELKTYTTKSGKKIAALVVTNYGKLFLSHL